VAEAPLVMASTARIVVLAALALGASAFAQEEQGSPRSGAIRLNLGSYRPAIDSESGLEGTPFADTFGSTSMLLFQVQYERYILQRLGALGAGFSAGYSEKYGNSSAVGDPSVETKEKTALHVYPFQVYALYNFDYTAKRLHVPLVPYVKGGVAFVPWRITKGGKVETVDGNKAEGGKWGLVGTAGIAFLLDVLEPRLAYDFDVDIGVNHSYLFAQYELLRTGVFGGGGLNLSSNHFMFGLALEF
jgi:hypothetical protein